MSGPPRYAIYFVPPADSVLYRFGSSILGYDCHTGTMADRPRGVDVPEDWADLTEAPRRYGFHATLKAPFRLSQAYDEAALVHDVAGFGDQARDVALVEPVVRSLGQFIAIVPRGRNVVLDRLAADCVRHFDRFRAPLSAADRARRVTSKLTERERSNLNQWGYPYVFDDFRFHMTLTGPIGDERRGVIADLLSTLFFRCHDGQAVPIDRIVLLRQDHEEAHFRVLCEATLRNRATAQSLP